MTITPARLAELRAFAATDEMCPRHCLIVRDLLDEVEHLRAQVARLVTDVIHWQALHQEACGQIAAGLRRP